MAYSIRPLSINDENDVYEMLQQIPKDENGFVNKINGLSYSDYKLWLLNCHASSQKTGVEDGWKVPQSVYWMCVDEIPVGMGKIRHLITDKLLEEGGSIGYAIIPSQRQKGYGTILLRELVKEAARLKIGKVLLTIRNDNIASIKVALANGGVIENADDIRHYIWIGCEQPNHK